MQATKTTNKPEPVLLCLIDSYKNRISDIEETEQSRTAYYKRSISNDRFTPYERKKWRKLVKWPDSCEFDDFGFMEKSGLEFIKINSNNYILSVICEPYVDIGHYELFLIDLSGKSVKTMKLNLRQYKYDDDKWVSYTSNYVIGQPYFYTNTNELGLFHEYSKDVMCGHQVEYKISTGKNNKIIINLTKANGNYNCNKNIRRTDWPKIKLTNIK